MNNYQSVDAFAKDLGFGVAGRLAYNANFYGSASFMRESLMGIVEDSEFVAVYGAFVRYVSALTTAAGYSVSDKVDIISKVLSIVRHSSMDPVIYLSSVKAFASKTDAATLYSQCIDCEISALSVTCPREDVRSAKVNPTPVTPPTVETSMELVAAKLDDYLVDDGASSVSSAGSSRSGRRRLHNQFWSDRREVMSKVAGHCYLAMFKPRYVEMVSRELSASPMLAAILGYENQKYDMGNWGRLYVSKQRNNVLHVSADGTWPLIDVVSSFIAGHPTVGPHLKHLTSFGGGNVPGFPGRVTMGLSNANEIRNDVSALRSRRTVLAVHDTTKPIDATRAKPRRLFASARASSTITRSCIFTYALPLGSPGFVLIKPGVYISFGHGSTVGSQTEDTVIYVGGGSFDVQINMETERLYGLGCETTVEQFEEKFPLWAFQFDFLPFWARSVYLNAVLPKTEQSLVAVVHTPSIDDMVDGIDVPVRNVRTDEPYCVTKTGGTVAVIPEILFKTHPHACRVGGSITGEIGGVYFNTSLRLVRDDEAVLCLGGQATICVVMAMANSEYNVTMEEMIAVPAVVHTGFFSKF